PAEVDSGGRAALTFHPGGLMAVLTAGFVLIAVPVVVRSGGHRHRFATLGWVVGVVVMTLGIFATGSTSAIVALAAALVAVIAVVMYTGRVRSGRRRNPVAGMLLFAGAVAGVVMLFTSDMPVTERLT